MWPVMAKNKQSIIELLFSLQWEKHFFILKKLIYNIKNVLPQ